MKGTDITKERKPVVSAGEYNALTKSQVKLLKGEAINIIVDWYPGSNGIEPGSTHEFTDGIKKFSYRFLDSRRGEWIAGVQSFPTNSVVVISDEDYKELSASVTDQNIGYYHLINFKNWKTSQDETAALKKALGESEYKLIAITDNYESLKNGYSVFLFVSTVMGILFFVAGGSVLYFKQYTELPEAKVTFRKLYKIGISDKEMKSIIGKELAAVFFLPLIFGSFLGVSLIYLMTYIVGGEAIIREFLMNASAVVAIYFLSQGIYYVITRNKYNQEIIK
jgi:putative ABC transport system permease protein